MAGQAFLEYCLNTYGTAADYPFDDGFETAVFRHAGNRKWYAIMMRVSRRKFGIDSDEVVDVVNLPEATARNVRLVWRGGWCVSGVSYEL